MLERLAFIPVAIVLASIAIYFDFTYVGFGVLIGITLPFCWALNGEKIIPSIELGGLIGLIGLACYIAAKYVALKNGLTLEELDAARKYSKFIRRLPYYSITAITTGLVLVIMGVLKKHDDE